MIKKILFIVIVITQTTTISAQSSKNINLLANFTFPASRGDMNDIWGYVDTLGNEYAIIGMQDGVAIVDVSIPTAPVEVFYTSGANSIWRDIKVWNKHAYITNESSGGLMIIDMTNLPGTLTTANVSNYGGNTYPFTKAHDIFIDENGVGYIMGSNNGVGGAIILDLATNPNSPTELGRYNDFYLHDGMARGDTLWGAAINDGFFAVIDVSNKATPVTMATHASPSSFTHNVWISDDGKTLFTTDEKSNAFIGAYDVSNLSNITELDKIQSNPGQLVIPHNAFFINNFVATSYYRDGVVLFDVSQPSNMVEVGHYDTSPQFSGDGYNGCWGVYPWLPSGNIIASDIENGLFVLGPTYVTASFLKGNITDASTTAPINGALVEIVATTTTTTSNLLGNYATGIVDAGTYNIIYSKLGYQPDTIFNLALSSGFTVIQDVALVPIATFAYEGHLSDALTGNPIAGAKVRLKATGYDFTVSTDVNGNFVIPNVSIGNYDVTIGKWGYQIYCSQNEILNPAGNIHQYTLNAGYYDDFSFNFGWTVTGTPISGDWVRGIPIGTNFNGTPSNPGVDVSTDCNDEAYVTGNAGGSVGNDDIDGGETILTSPTFDLSSYTDPYLFFDRWFFNGGGLGTPNDSLVITLNNGVTSQVIDFATVTDPDLSTWATKSFKLSSIITVTNNMSLTIRAMDISPGHISEAGFDNFYVVDSAAVGINDVNKNDLVIIYPNPFNSTINIKLNSTNINNIRIEVFDIAGRRIENKLFQNKNIIRFNNNYKKGVYFINIYMDNELMKTEKLIKL